MLLPSCGNRTHDGHMKTEDRGFRRLVVPGLACALVLIVIRLVPDDWRSVAILARSAGWICGAWLVVRLLDVLLWQGLLRQRTGHAPPRLLSDLLAAAVLASALLMAAAREWQVPVAGIITTSGVLVAVIGFALRDMLASLFAGIALNLERPYAIGDWIAEADGEAGMVIEVGWLTTRLRTKGAVTLVIPNARLATGGFRNYGHRGELFRDEIKVTLDHALAPGKADRVLLAALRAVVDVERMQRAPDVRIATFDERGVVWLVRFWVDDYDRLVDVRYAVQRSVLQHLHQAGIGLPYGKLDLYHAPMPDRSLDYVVDRDRVLQRSELFRDLDGAEVKALAAGAMERRVAGGEIIVRRGEAGRSLFVVLEGVLVALFTDGEGRESVVNRITAGGIFGEFALLTGEPRSATVRAESECVLLEIDEEVLAPVLRRSPQLAAQLSRTLARRKAVLDNALGEAGARAGTDVRATEDRLLTRIRSLFGL